MARWTPEAAASSDGLAPGRSPSTRSTASRFAPRGARFRVGVRRAGLRVFVRAEAGRLRRRLPASVEFAQLQQALAALDWSSHVPRCRSTSRACSSNRTRGAHMAELLDRTGVQDRGRLHGLTPTASIHTGRHQDQRIVASMMAASRSTASASTQASVESLVRAGAVAYRLSALLRRSLPGVRNLTALSRSPVRWCVG